MIDSETGHGLEQMVLMLANVKVWVGGCSACTGVFSVSTHTLILFRERRVKCSLVYSNCYIETKCGQILRIIGFLL